MLVFCQNKHSRPITECVTRIKTGASPLLLDLSKIMIGWLETLTNKFTFYASKIKTTEVKKIYSVLSLINELYSSCLNVNSKTVNTVKIFQTQD